MAIDIDFSSALGAGVSGLFGAAGGLAQTSANKAAQQRQFRFQEMMYRNRYQFTMEDMQAAGLNPILAYRQGGGGAPPGGAMAGAPNIMEAAAGSARGLAKMSADVKLAKMGTRLRRTEIGLRGAQEAATTWQAELNRKLTKKAEIDAEVSSATAANIRTQTTLGRTAIPAAKAQETLDKTTLGGRLRQLNRIIRSITGRDATGARQ